MPLSSRSVLRSEESIGQVVDYSPTPLVVDKTDAAQKYLQREKERKTSFRLSELVAEQAGIAKMERQTLQDRIESLALEKVQEIQERAYREAYALGMDEGREKAFQDQSENIKERFNKLDEIMVSLGRIRLDLCNQNEAHLIQLVFHLVEKVVLHTVEKDSSSILPILREAVELAHAEENILVSLSKEDHDFIEAFREKAGQEFQFLKKIRMDKREDIRPGGCVVETNYGTVDARIPERLSKLWEALKDKLPRTKVTKSESGEVL